MPSPTGRSVKRRDAVRRRAFLLFVGEAEADTGVSTPVFPVTTSTRRGEPVLLLFGVRLSDGWLGSNELRDTYERRREGNAPQGAAGAKPHIPISGRAEEANQGETLQGNTP